MERKKNFSPPELQAVSTLAQEALRQVSSPETLHQEVLYQTRFGTVTFADICTRTRRYAAYVLSHTYHMRPDIVDEALQVGFSGLWEMLAQTPDRFQDADIPVIGQRVVFQALHGLKKDWQYQQKTVANASSTSGKHSRPHSNETRQSDLKIDLHQAIALVAQNILNSSGKQQSYDLWALYGLTALQTSANETAQLFGVRKQSMQKAFQRTRQQLQAALPHYAPTGPTRPVRHRTKSVTNPEIQQVRALNSEVSDAVFAFVLNQIIETGSDTQKQDELALAGIKAGTSALAHGKSHDIHVSKMQRAYNRVHLMIAAVNDPTIRPRRPEKRKQFQFELNSTTGQAVHDLALQLEKQPKSFERLVALHTHINNLPISRTANHFNIPPATLRYYVMQIGERLGTPRQSAGQDRRGYRKATSSTQAQSVSGTD